MRLFLKSSVGILEGQTFLSLMRFQEVLVHEMDRVPSPNMDGFEVVGCSENAGEDLGDEILVNLESYLDDINDRLMISRMVSDSVIKGMVKAVEQEAAEKIEAKEQEVAYLKRCLLLPDVGFGKTDISRSSFEKNLLAGKSSQTWPDPFRDLRNTGCFGAPGCQNDQRYMSFEELCSTHDKMMESVVGTRNVAIEELNSLRKRASRTGCSSTRRNGSGSELVGLGGILKEDCQSCDRLDEVLDSVKKIVDGVCSQADASLRLSKSVLSDWVWERDFGREVESFVIQSSIRNTEEEVEHKIWHLNTQLCNSQSSIVVKSIDKISCLREELGATLKSLSNIEPAQLISHGSHDADHFHRNLLTSHSSSIWEGNGILEGSNAEVPEKFEFTQLKFLCKEELFSYFNDMIMKMRRNHESTIQKLTEDYFSLKREYFKERGSLLPHKKDKEFDITRKRVSEIIAKLDDILEEIGKVPQPTNGSVDLSSSKDKFDIPLSENSELRNSLGDKENKLESLSSQLSDARRNVLQQCLAEEKLLQLTRKLKYDLEAADVEKPGMESISKQEMYDILMHGAAIEGETAVRDNGEVANVESAIMQGLFELILMEALKDAGRRIEELYGEYLVEQEKQTSLALKTARIENELRLVTEGNERMKSEISLLGKQLEEKEKIATEVSMARRQEKEQFELASKELESVRQEANHQRSLAFEHSKELKSVKDKLVEALLQIEDDKVKFWELDEKLAETCMDANEQRRMVFMLSQEKHENLQLISLKEEELNRKMETVVFDAQKLLKAIANFQSEITGKIKACNIRLEDSFFHLSSLLDKAKSIKLTGLKYENMFERKREDLQMAEAEVDLLGDEVDMLLNLLEKIYIALNHYSPILQHYPGIMEILTLMKRELSGEAIKLL